MSTVKQGQSFLDKVLQTTGSLAAAFEMATLNGASITDDLAIGSEVTPGPIDNKNIVSFWQNDIREPATDIFVEYESLKSGIDYWAVNVDFVVTPLTL